MKKGRIVADITSCKFGKWTALNKDYDRSTNKHIYWICCCECGTIRSVLLRSLKNHVSIQCENCRFQDRKGKIRYLGHEDGKIPRSYWCRLKGCAEYRGISFEITIEDAWNVFLSQQKKCSLTGQEIGFFSCTSATASLDRIDSSKGYVVGNIQWLHKDINMLKNNYKEEHFIEMCKEISEWQNRKIGNQII